MTARPRRARRDDLDRLWGAGPLPFHRERTGPAARPPRPPDAQRSRGEISPAERRIYSPEAQGPFFPLRWLAVDPWALVSPRQRHRYRCSRGSPGSSCAAIRRVDQAALSRRLAGLGRRLLLPAHPWEADHLAAVAEPLPCTSGRRDGPRSGEGVPGHADDVRAHLTGGTGRQAQVLVVRAGDQLHAGLPRRGCASPSRLTVSPGADSATRRSGPPPTSTWWRTPPNCPYPMKELRFLACRSARLAARAPPTDAHCRARRGHCLVAASRPARGGRRRPPEWFARHLEVVAAPLRLNLDLGLCFERHQQNTLSSRATAGPARRLPG